MNTLAGRIKDGKEGVKITGRGVFLSDESKKNSNVNQNPSLLGYVLQHDHLLPNLTTRETLMYAGLMKLPSSMTYKQKRRGKKTSRPFFGKEQL